MGVMDYRIRAGASGMVYEYNVPKSCRFNDNDSAYLSRTFGTPTNNKKWTLSLWLKKSNLTQGQLFSAGGNQIFFVSYSGNYQFSYCGADSGTTERMLTSAYYRDPSAWMHLVFSMDTTQSAFSDQMKLYINGTQVTAFDTSTAVTQDINTQINSAIEHRIGCYSGGSEFFDGYLAEVNFIDGQQLTQASFGETNADTGQWQAKSFSGTYGSNGFRLNFSDSAALGADTSGEGNTFTVSNLAATDQVGDGPKASDGVVGSTTASGNFCTLNPLFKYYGNAVMDVSTFSEGNTQLNISGPYGFGVGTFSVGSGKWYYEIAGITDNQTTIGAWKEEGLTYTNVTFSALWNYRYYGNNGIVYNDNGATVQTYSTYTTGDVIGCALDMDNGKIFFAKNGTWQGSSDPAAGTNPAATTNLTDGKPWVPGFTADSSQSVKVNFGQDSSFSGSETAQGNSDINGFGDFYYTPPAGYLALCSANLPAPSIALPGEHYNAITYTGDGATRSLTGVGFQPDWLVVKRRDANHSWMNYDVVRGFSGGVGYRLAWNNGEVESAVADGLTSFDSDGFSVGSATGVNVNTGTYAAYNWKGGGTAVSNTDGTITSSVSANTTAGFSIVGWTGTEAVGTVGHGLSAAPELIIVKDRESGAAWRVGSDDIPTAWEYVCYFNQTPGATDENTAFNDTDPTTSVFTLGASQDTNTSGNGIIAYCIHSVEGYSKVGSYTGNGNTDGPFIYTGFRPAFLLCKNTSATEGWNLWDSARMPYNKMPKQFMPDDNRAEYVANTTTFAIDFVSNGVKLRTDYSMVNNNAHNFVYWAFAEYPFKFSNAR